MSVKEDQQIPHISDPFTKAGTRVYPSLLKNLNPENLWYIVGVKFKYTDDLSFLKLYDLAKLTYDVSDADMRDIVQFLNREVTYGDKSLQLVAFKSALNAEFFCAGLKQKGFTPITNVMKHEAYPRPPEYQTTFLG